MASRNQDTTGNMGCGCSIILFPFIMATIWHFAPSLPWWAWLSIIGAVAFATLIIGAGIEGSMEASEQKRQQKLAEERQKVYEQEMMNRHKEAEERQRQVKLAERTKYEQARLEAQAKQKRLKNQEARRKQEQARQLEKQEEEARQLEDEREEIFRQGREQREKRREETRIRRNERQRKRRREQKASQEWLERLRKEQEARLESLREEREARLESQRKEQEARINELLQRDEVMDHVHYMNGHEFEGFMADLFRKQGYSVKRTPGSGDQGVDLLVNMDGRNVAVQLKRWTTPVGNAAVHATFAGMVIHKAQEAWLVTTSTFTKSAKEAARKTGVRLVDGHELAAWMISLREEK